MRRDGERMLREGCCTEVPLVRFIWESMFALPTDFDMTFIHGAI